MKRAGRRLRAEHLEVRAADSLLSYTRVAVIVAKYGHTIVERNRLRRRLRELARTKIIPWFRGVDVVIRALPSAYGATFGALMQEVEGFAEQLASAKNRL